MIITTSVQRGPGVQTEELIGIMSALCLFSRQDQREKPTVLSEFLLCVSVCLVAVDDMVYSLSRSL